MTATRLGIDFGTSNTAAVLRRPDGTTKALLFDGSELLPSAVCRAQDGTLLVGRDAIRAARTDPSGFEPHPKRCIDDGTVVLGGRELPVTTVIAAVLRRVVDEATRVAGQAPDSVTLTCPANWGPRRRAVLLDAAREAGADRAELVAEPVAAAHAYLATEGARLPVGGTLLVYDLGAGTFDASVVRRTTTGFDVLAEAGLDDAGGLEVDAAVIAYLGAVYGARDPQLWQRLTAPATDGDRRAARQLWDDVRAAKESLSRAATTVIHVPLFDDDAPLGREQLDQLAGPIIDRTIHQCRVVLREAGQSAESLDGVLLVGGGSRLPLVATVLHRRLGVAPISVERPELLVAEGSTTVAPAESPSAEPPPETPAATADVQQDAQPAQQEVTLPADEEPVEVPQEILDAQPAQQARAAKPGPAHARRPGGEQRPPITTGRRRWRWPVLLLVVLLVVAGAVYAGNRWSGTQWSGGPLAGVDDNCIDVNLISSDEKANILTTLAKQFRSSGTGVDGHCVNVDVSTVNSRLVGDALSSDAEWPADRLKTPRPDVWTPSSSVWTERLRASKHGDMLAPTLQSVTRTPVVIGMPRPMAEALGWPHAEIGWKDLATLAADPNGWGAKGHPEWGPFTLGKTNPNTSTTGLLSLASTAAAFGFPSEDAKEKVRALELATVHYGSSSSTFTKNLYQADSEGRGLHYVSAIALEEQVIFQYNRGNLLDDGPTVAPKTKLAAIYPADGTISSDNPYAILKAPWATDAKTRAADAFLKYVHDQAELFRAEGFRDAEGHAGKALKDDENLKAEPSYTTVPPPGADVVDQLLKLWAEVRKPASVLIVVDESGSMDDLVGNKTRLELAKEAAKSAVDSLAPTDEIGLWAFSGKEKPKPNPWRELLPLSPVGTAAEQYRKSVDKLYPHGDTALYATIRSAVDMMKKEQDDKRIYAVIVLSDGANDYRDGTGVDNDLGKLKTDLSQGSLERPVRVFTIAYGTDAESDVLDGIAQSARGKNYNSKNAVDINTVFADVLTNF